MAEEVKEKDDQESTEKAQPKRKKVPINIIIIGILALSILGGGIYVWKSGLFSGDSDNIAIEDELDNPEMGPTYPMDTFIVNLIGERGKNYLKVKIELELDDEKTTTEINKRLPQFRDAVLTTLSSKSNEDINTLEGKFQLRAEILSNLNQYLTTGKIFNIYFTDFIVQ